ncbi:MAG: C_GCAxxG_C_C family protein [Clostridiales bacterium]|nr:C_GCAxxG_C_C family protein [Clostridiales bacterium]
MDKAQVADLFMRGQDCSQVVISHYAEKLGLSEEQANRIAACYGGGSGIGETCGAVVGALMVIGLKYGHKGPDDMDQRNELMAKRAEFFTAWKEKRGSCMCRELLGYDVTKPEEFQIILEKGLMFDLCPELVLDAIDILDNMTAEH